jgi:hypothetical protein
MFQVLKEKNEKNENINNIDTTISYTHTCIMKRIFTHTTIPPGRTCTHQNNIF